MLKGASYIAFWKFSKSKIFKNGQQQIFKNFQQQIFKKISTANFQKNFNSKFSKNFQQQNTKLWNEFCYQQRWQKLIQYQNEKQYIAEASENFLSTRI